MSHKFGSLDYRTLNKSVADVLSTRSLLDNTVQIAKPFLKATTTLQLAEYLGEGNIGFSLGIQTIDQDVAYEDIYSDTTDGTSTNPMIGYTYTPEGKTKRVYAQSPNSEASAIASLFDRNMSTANTSDFVRIPPPGITKMTVGRNRNGLLAQAQLHITVPSLIQLEILHRTFLIPGCGMVLEWGQQFAPDIIGTEDRVRIEDYMFPWYDRNELTKMLSRLAKRDFGLEEILEKHVYPSKGQYMWMFGRVANFSVKAAKDGSFECVVKVVGPSEDGWAYSVQNTVIPPVDASKNFCSADSNSVESYFKTTVANSLNFKSLLDNVRNDKNDPWHNHVVVIPKSNKKHEPTSKDANLNPSEIEFLDSENSYFITWKFFVNVVLNDRKRGLMAIFANSNTISTDQLDKICLLRPYFEGNSKDIDAVANKKYIDDPMEQYVGMNVYLRSTDPSTMMLVNEIAAVDSSQDITYFRQGAAEEFFAPSELTTAMLSQGEFSRSISEAEKNTPTCEVPDKGFLSSGVWLNHKAVVASMLGADTIMRGIVNLLNRMNAATKGYWNLTVDVAEPHPDVPNSSYNYTIMDANYRENIAGGVADFIDNVYVFNKYIRSNSGNLVGSELLDCSVDLSLPKLLFAQIATLGLVQPSDLKNLGVGKEDVDSATLLSDPQDAFRKMFSITTISPKQVGLQGPDLTNPPAVDPTTVSPSSFCGQTNSQVTAGAGGVGLKPGPMSEIAKAKTIEDIQKRKKEAQDSIDACMSACTKEAELTPTAPISSPTTPTPVPTTTPVATTPIKQNGLSSKSDEDTLAEAAKFISPEEGFSKTAYYDPKGQTTLVSIGYGHQIKAHEYAQGYIVCGSDKVPIVGVRGIDTVMTKEQSVSLLQSDLKIYSSSAQSGVGSAWNILGTNQKVALISYAYNTGGTKTLLKHGLLDTIAKKDSVAGGNVISEYGVRTANGVLHPGLVARRAKEGALYASSPLMPTPPLPQASPSPSPTTQSPPLIDIGGSSLCEECKQTIPRNKEIIRQADVQINSDTKLTTEKNRQMREFPALNSIIRYVEMAPDVMIKKIRNSSDGSIANAFGAAPASLSITADLQLPGINGLRVGELFWVDRIPAFYKAFGAFQIISIEEVISVTGWTTNIHSRFNYMGNHWKTAMYSILSAPGASK